MVHSWAQRLFTRWRRILEQDDSDEREALLEKNAEWLIVLVLSVSRLLGVLLSLGLDDMMASVSQCALGSHLLVEAMESWLDPVLSQLHLPTIHSTSILDLAAHSILFAWGMWQTVLVALFGGQPRSLPSVLKVLLTPLRAFEFILSKFVIR